MRASVGDYTAATYRPISLVPGVFRLPIKLLNFVEGRLEVRFGQKSISVRARDFPV